MERSAVGCVVGVLMLAGGVAPVGAQTGGGYDLSRNVIAAGGATFSTGSNLSLGGTGGQADAGTLTGSPYSVSGGFWGALLSVPMATPTPTNTPTLTNAPTHTPTNTPTLTPTSTRTNTPMNTPALTPIATSSFTPVRSVSPTPPTVSPSPGSPTATVTGTPTATPTPTACVGDCNGYGQVTVDDILTMVNIALGNSSISDCQAGDANHDGQITLDEILSAVNNALKGCGS